MQKFKFSLFKYAGIGSRQINQETSIIKMQFAFCMAFAGYHLNSGGADGSDTSYEEGARLAYDEMCKIDKSLIPGEYSKVMTVFLPWKGFNYRRGGEKEGYIIRESSEAKRITSMFHAGWDKLNDAVKSLMSRNAMQVLTVSLCDPVKFISCYTEDGACSKQETTSKTGGTGQAIRIGDYYGVNIYNMGKDEHLEKIRTWINDYSNKIINKYNIDPKVVIEQNLANRKAVTHTNEDIMSLIESGKVNVIVNDCDCEGNMCGAFSDFIKKQFPDIYHIEKNKKKNPKRLGTYSCEVREINGKPISIISAYTQLESGSMTKCYVNYDAVRNVLKQVKNNFKNSQIAIPRIGMGNANGCWITIANIIKGEMNNMKSYVVDTYPEHVLEIKQCETRDNNQFSLEI